jgi:hypothetical protein
VGGAKRRPLFLVFVFHAQFSKTSQFMTGSATLVSVQL